jgi:outer membrane protein with beta-barrel domain
MLRSFLVVLAMAPFAARALDVSAGTVEVTGGSNLGLSFSSSDVSGSTGSSSDTTQYGGDVTALYYVIPNLGVGLALSGGRAESKSSEFKSTSWSYLVGPAVGFVYPLQEKLSLALQGDAGWVRSKFSLRSSSTVSGGGGIVGLANVDSGSSGFGFELGAGVRYFLARSFSVDAGLVYQYERTTFDAVAGTTQPTLTSSGLRLGAGLSVYFGN